MRILDPQHADWACARSYKSWSQGPIGPLFRQQKLNLHYVANLLDFSTDCLHTIRGENPQLFRLDVTCWCKHKLPSTIECKMLCCDFLNKISLTLYSLVVYPPAIQRKGLANRAGNDCDSQSMLWLQNAIGGWLKCFSFGIGEGKKGVCLSAVFPAFARPIM